MFAQSRWFAALLGLIGVLWLIPAAALAAPDDANTPRLVVQLGHAGVVNSAVFSGDGKRVLTASWDGTARLWDVETGKEIRQFQANTEWVYSAAFSGDGKRVLTASDDKTARLWDAETGEEIRQFQGHTQRVISAVFSGDGKRVLTASDDNTARLWDVETGEEIRQFQGHADRARSAVFSGDGKRVLTSSWDKTARLWDVESGKEIRQFQGHDDHVLSAVFSGDGKRVLTASDDNTARLWDVETGKEIRQFKGSDDKVYSCPVFSAVFSGDGKRVLTASDDMTARMWDVETGKEIRQFQGHAMGVASAVFSGDGKRVLTASFDRTARLWDAETGKEIRQFQGQSLYVRSAVFSGDGKRVLTASGESMARLWDVETGKEIRPFQGQAQGVTSAVFSGDGKRVLTAALGYGVLQLWDVETGKEIRQFQGHADLVNSAVFSADGKRVLTASSDKAARLWDVETGKEVRQFKGHADRVNSAVFSGDGKRVLTASADQTARLWDAETGVEIRRFRGHAIWVSSAMFSGDGKRVLTASFDRSARLWDVETGKEIHQFRGHTGSLFSAVFSGDGKRVLTASGDRTARLWDVETGEEIRRFQGHAHRVISAVFSADGKRVLTASDDKTARLWDVETGKELSKLMSFRDGSWAVTDNDGRFDASNGGDVDGLHWIVGNEPIALNQLKQRYYDPGLLAKHMGFNNQPLRSVEAFKNVKMYPEVEVDLPIDGKKNTVIKLTNRGGGIGKVVVLVNGQELLGDARGPKPKPDEKETTLKVDLSAAINLIKGQPNTVEVIAYNAEGYLASRGLTKIFTPDGDPEEHKPELYAIVCGVSHFADSKLNLQFAAKDAEDFAAALELGGKRLFGVNKVHLSLLTTSDSPGATAPTKENIRKAFAAAEKAKSEDILVVYLAGHGTTLGRGSDLYLYPTRDARGLDAADFADKAVLENTAISSAELTVWLLRIAANKKVMVLDTCAAGAAAAKLTEKRDIDGDQVRALDQLKDRTGFHVLMGCAANRVSYESTQFAQGLLTYSLLEGIKGAALQPGGIVDVAKLFGHAAQRVPELAAGRLGGVQRPEVIQPKSGQPFAIGQITPEDQPKVRLAVARPLMLRSKFFDEDALDDVLGLDKKIDLRLRGISSRGRDAGLVFVDTAEFPDAYRLVGKYKVDGDMVTVTVNVLRGKQSEGQLKATGQKDKPDELADRICHDVEKLLAERK